MCIASQRLESSIIGAVGYDVHVATTTPLSIGQRTTVIFGSEVPEMEVGVPGIIHWVNSANDGLEAGVALRNQFLKHLKYESQAASETIFVTHAALPEPCIGRRMCPVPRPLSL